MGLGEGYKGTDAHAIATLNPEIGIQMDADQQDDPLLQPLFINLTQYGFTLVIGPRFAPGAGRPSLLFRRMISLVGTALIGLAAGLPRSYDRTSGYRCISVDVLVRCNLQSLATRA